MKRRDFIYKSCAALAIPPFLGASRVCLADNPQLSREQSAGRLDISNDSEENIQIAYAVVYYSGGTPAVTAHGWFSVPSGQEMFVGSFNQNLSYQLFFIDANGRPLVTNSFRSVEGALAHIFPLDSYVPPNKHYLHTRDSKMTYALRHGKLDLYKELLVDFGQMEVDKKTALIINARQTATTFLKVTAQDVVKLSRA